MDRLAWLTLPLEGQTKQIELYFGDLTRPAPTQASDILVVSAFRDNYVPTRRSLIGALHEIGIAVGVLARDKELDLREAGSCWLSRELVPPSAGLPYRRILCFEPQRDARPPERVGDIFRTLVSAMESDASLTRVAMPLVCTGAWRQPVMDMLPPLLEAAVEWMRKGSSLQTLRIVLYSRAGAAAALAAIRSLKQWAGGRATPLTPELIAQQPVFLLLARFAIDEPAVKRITAPWWGGWLSRSGSQTDGRQKSPKQQPPAQRLTAAARAPDAGAASSLSSRIPEPISPRETARRDPQAGPAALKYDVFISYTHNDADAVLLLAEEVRRRRPGARVFLDQMSLRPGQSWQAEIFEAIEASRVFVPFYSPNYLTSKVCMEEYNVARVCARTSDCPALFPIYLYSAKLPAYMRILHYLDCTEADKTKIRAAAESLSAKL